MNMLRNLALAVITTVGALAFSAPAGAVTTTFFDLSQTATLEVSGATFDTISSNGYLFTCTPSLFTDFALTGITLVDASAAPIPEPET